MSLARPGRKQARATELFEVHIPDYDYDWSNISTVYIHIKRLASDKIF
jgi:hypothetical protein